jgi:hypothetical protein
MDSEAEMECRGHRYGRKIRGSMAAGADVVDSGKVCDLFRMCDAAAMHDSRTDVVDPLMTDEVMCIP